jgi:hypothetical protein
MSEFNAQDQNIDWALADKDVIHRAIFALIDIQDTPNNKQGTPQPLRGLAVYLGRDAGTYSKNHGLLGGASNDNAFGTGTRLNFNLTAIGIDTLTAKLASITCMPQAVTNKATAKGRQTAEDINFVVKGIYHKYDIDNLMVMAHRDAMCNRAGFIKICVEEKELYVERIFADEVVVDLLDGYYNDPYKIVHRKTMPKSVLLMQYPTFAKEIESANTVLMRVGNYNVTTPCVVIAEAWCKNTYKEKGRHVVCIETATFVDEEWDKDYLPILKFDYNPPIVGWTGQSVVDELEPIQRELDKLFLVMQTILKNVSVPRIFYDTNSMMNKEHFTNRVGGIIGMDLKNGVPPIVHNGAAMPPEIPAQIEFLISQGYARIGITPTDTQGQMPQGINQQSGEALKSLTQIAAERWKFLKSIFERAHIRLLEVLLKEISRVNIKLSSLDDKIGLRQVSTKSLPKDANSYVLQVFPVSLLPQDIGGRIDSVKNMLDMGIIQREDAPDLFDIPDLGAHYALQSAPRKLAALNLEKMLTNKEYITPEPYDDLQYSLTIALRYYAWERMNENDEENLKLLRQFINDCQELLTKKGEFQNGINSSAGTQQQQQLAQGTAQPGQPSPAVPGVS